MKRSLIRWPLAAAAWLALAAARGAEPVPAAPLPTDPAALVALDRMGAYLRTLMVFHVEAAIEQEDVLDSGLKVQYNAAVKLAAKRPDRLCVRVSGDGRERQYFYDGKQFTLWAPRLSFYATVPAPPTIREVAATLEEKFGIELPLVDLFRWGTEAGGGAAITAAVYLGRSMVGDARCAHYAFRQEGLDWQVWIQDGEFPLPRKLVLTTTTDEARPQYQAIYTWNLAPTIQDTDFTFGQPTGAFQIVFATIAPETGADAGEK